MNFANVVNFSFLFFIFNDDLSDDVRTGSLGKFVPLSFFFRDRKRAKSNREGGEKMVIK